MKKLLLLILLVLSVTLVSCGNNNTLELKVGGESMENTLRNGDKVLVDIDEMEISRYDIIAFTPHNVYDATRSIERQEYYIKRIYGLPEETIYLKDNAIFINGEKIEDPYANGAIDESEIELGTEEKPYTLKEDEYYVLGDKRTVSLDSRFLPTGEHAGEAPGPVKQERIIGKVVKRWNEVDSKWIDINE